MIVRLGALWRLCTLIDSVFFACCTVRYWQIVADTPALDLGMHCQPKKLCSIAIVFSVCDVLCL